VPYLRLLARYEELADRFGGDAAFEVEGVVDHGACGVEGCMESDIEVAYDLTLIAAHFGIRALRIKELTA